MNGLSSFLWIGLQLMRVALALMVGGWAFHEGQQGLASDKWPSINGRVTTSEIKTVQTRRGQHDEADIRYQYIVNGKLYTSKRVQFGGDMFRNPADILEKYKADKQVAIHYKPENPEVSCLERGFNLLSVLPCLAVGIFFALFAMKEQHEKGTKGGTSLRSKTDINSNSIAMGGRKANKARSAVVVPFLIMGILAFSLKVYLEHMNVSGVHSTGVPSSVVPSSVVPSSGVPSSGVHFGGINLVGITLKVFVVSLIFLAGLAFVYFLTSLPPTIAMLMRAKKLKLAEMVARLNTGISYGLSPQSFEAAIALGLQAEIAQERLQYEKALEFSKRALNVVADRPKRLPNVSGDGTDKRLREHMVRYAKSNSPVEVLCHESLGCILLDMGLDGEAMSHAETAKRLAQDCVKNSSSALESERAKFALAAALTFIGRVELAMGSLDEARSDLEESIKLRKELPRQFEENLATSMAYLASTYCLQSETRKAERTIEEGLKVIGDSLAPSHCLARAKLISSLAEVRMHNEQLSNAEALLRDCLDTREKLLVPGHPEIARTLLAIANLKEAQGRNRDAEQHRETASEMLTICFGKQRQLA